MPKFLVRMNCEYSLLVEDAKSEKEALTKADKVDLTEWDVAWSSAEVEEYEEEKV